MVMGRALRYCLQFSIEMRRKLPERRRQPRLLMRRQKFRLTHFLSKSRPHVPSAESTRVFGAGGFNEDGLVMLSHL